MHKEYISYDKDDMKVIIDDIKLNINVLEYIEVKEKYDWYLRCLKYFGNFITFEHLNLLLKGKLSRGKIFNDITTLSDLNFVKKHFIGKNSYYILTKKANIYLKNKNEGGYINKPANRNMIKSLLHLDYLILGIKDRSYINKENEEELNLELESLYEDITNINTFNEGINIRHKNVYKILKKLNFKIDLIEDPVRFFDEQINLLNENEGDILSKLKSKNAYIDVANLKNEKLILDILILDNENIQPNKFKYLILDLEDILKELYLNPAEQRVKYNLSIISIDSNRKNNLEAVLPKAIENEILKKDKFLNHYSYQGELLLDNDNKKTIKSQDLLLAFNDYKVLEYDTSRYFRYKNDEIKSIDSSEINVINLALK
ncbi:hypothetical protein [Clostridium tertium]|jgi:hypothetical protein|uniref:hypothetical protein n=1 Tax=Clostridium tertium TaxID=1559 RepID=UPI0023B2C3F0|nr:hypothetical protein [Clostridium tertium]